MRARRLRYLVEFQAQAAAGRDALNHPTPATWTHSGAYVLRYLL